MKKDNINLIDSVLSVKASGIELEQSVKNDLQQEEGKSIAELLYDQEKNTDQTN